MASCRVILFYMFKKMWASGMTTYTAHLYKALKDAGHYPKIYRPAGYDTPSTESFGEYGIPIYNLSVQSALAEASVDAAIIVAPSSPEKLPDPKLVHKLQQKGARVVIHDPTQMHCVPTTVQPPILVRKSMTRIYKNGVYIPHPYVAQGAPAGKGNTKHAVCTARIATSKRPRLILQANQLLPKRLRVDMKGAAQNRMLSYGLEKTYGDVYKQPKTEIAYRQNFEAPVDLCSRYRYHVDFTKFDGDGGGTQYAQLEAIDAECVPIMHTDWLDQAHGGLDWAYFLNGPESLARVLKAAWDNHSGYYTDSDEIVRNAGRRLLKEHDHVKIGKIYAEELGL